MPGRWDRFWALQAGERRLLLTALVWLSVVQIGLRLVGYRRTKGLLDQLGTGAPYLRERSHPSGIVQIAAAQRVGRVVNLAAGPQVLRATCLPRSLLTWWFLRQRGIESTVIFGVPDESRNFTAHAWVEVAGTVVNDVPDVRERFGVLEAAGPPG